MATYQIPPKPSDNGFLDGLISPFVPNIATDGVNLADTVGLGGIDAFFDNLTSGEFIVNMSGVIIGLLMLLLAVYALVINQNPVTQLAKKVVK